MVKRASKPRKVGPWSARPGVTATLVAVLLAATGSGYGQVQTGTPAFASLSGGPFDTVNDANLDVHFAIPIVNKAGSGLPFYYTLTYDSSIWGLGYVNGNASWVPSANWGWGGVTDGVTGYVSYTAAQSSPSPRGCTWTGEYYSCTCFYDDEEYNYTFTHYSNALFYDATGTSHLFTFASNFGTLSPTPPSQCNPTPPTITQQQVVTAADSSGYTISANPDFTGTTVTSASGDVITPLVAGGSSSSITDPNGNIVSATYGATTNFTDTLGVAELTVSGTPPGNVTYTYPAPSGNVAITAEYTTKTITTSFSCGLAEFSGTAYLVSQIDFPDDTNYSFGYDSFGRLNLVTLRTGGTISYEYSGGNNGMYCPSSGTGDGTIAALTRTTPDSTTPWTYTHSENGTQWTSTLEDPLSSTTTYTFQDFNSQGPYETERTNSLETVYTCYNGDTSSTCTTSFFLPITELQQTTTLGGATSRRTTYVNSDGLPTKVDEYGFASGGSPGGFVRETMTCYASLSNPNILNRPATALVYTAMGNPTNCTGTSGLAAKSTYSYNGSTGNPLGVTKTTNVSTGATIRDSFTYATNGAVETATDFNGNTTTYTNTSCNNAFPTTVQGPAVGSYTPMYTFTYDTGCNGAVVTNVTDNVNNVSTGYGFGSDPYWRLITTNFPDGGWKENAYSGATEVNIYTGMNESLPGGVPSCPATTGIGLAANCRQDETVLDSLGRPSTSQLVSDPSTGGSDISTTTYDSSGHVQEVAYPGGASDTYGGYDGLNRVGTVTHADSNAVHIWYGANVSTNGGRTSQFCSTVGYPTLTEDEAGHLRQTWTDGLGRLIEADEPDPGTGSLTSGSPVGTCYTYDALNDLTGVTQGSQTRSFAYDALGRLLSANTPESGTTHYCYTSLSSACTTPDRGTSVCSGSPGAICRRTDARSITTKYSYDALNRLISKSYSDGTTPFVQYFYDQAPSNWPAWSGVTFSNAYGKLALVCTGVAQNTCGSDQSPPQTVVGYSYDVVGRPVDFYRCSPYFCSNGGPSAAQYTYDLAGDVSESTQGFEEVTFGNSINSAQQVSQVTSSIIGDDFPSTLGTFTYTPFGAVSTLVDGCGGTGCTNVQETYDYNSRLQPALIQVAGGSGNSTCLVYDYYQNWSGFQHTCAVPTGTPSGGNNGSVAGYYYKDSFNTGLTHSAAYGYDSLNRVTSAATGVWGYSFGYDRYSNLLNMTVTQGSAPGLSVSVNANNQITSSGFSYDAAGNVLSDGTGTGSHSYTWDAEGRLTGVGGSGSASTYTYDALGERVEESLSGGSSYLEIYYDVFGDRLVTYNLMTEDEDFVAPVNGRNFVKYINSRIDFLHVNVLGSTGLITDNTGNSVIQDMLYYPWGQFWTNGPGDEADDTRFASMNERDPDSNLDPAEVRTYSSRLGRWMSPDPLGGDPTNPQSLNRYAYVMNNPTTFIDPSGLCGNQGQQPCPSPGPCSAQNWMPICTSGLQYGAAPPGSYDEFDTLENSTGTSPGQMNQQIGQETVTISAPGLLDSSTAPIFGLFDLGLPVSGPQSFSWWGAFATSLASWQNIKATQQNAWNEGYYGCIGNEMFPFKGLVAAAGAQFFEHGALEAADAVAPKIAGAYYHFTDGRFTAWGNSSKVLVPEAAEGIRGALEWVKVGGLAVTDIEFAHAIYTCSGKLQ